MYGFANVCQPTIEVKKRQKIVCETKFIAKSYFLNMRIWSALSRISNRQTLLVETAHLVRCTQPMTLVSALYGQLQGLSILRNISRRVGPLIHNFEQDGQNNLPSECHGADQSRRRAECSLPLIMFKSGSDDGLRHQDCSAFYIYHC